MQPSCFFCIQKNNSVNMSSGWDTSAILLAQKIEVLAEHLFVTFNKMLGIG
jgi:hypothetical protein